MPTKYARTMGRSSTRVSWLSLLVAEAPASAFEALRDAALPEATRAERVAIEREADDALRLRSLFTEHRQRAAELAALYEIAAQLTSLRDPDRLLEDIAARARELLGVDVAYLALHDGDGALSIRVAAGSMGTRLRGLRFSTDEGIAGLVFREGQPFWTADYQAERRIRHADAVDEAAREEGLGGILGVPLRIREDVIGVLFAGARGQRVFRDGEVALLSSLAAHAATVIDNAALFEDQRATASALALANEQLRDSLAAIDRAAALHERLTGIVVRGGGVPEVLAALSEILGVTVEFVDDAKLASITTTCTVDGTTVAPVSSGEEVLAWLVAADDISRAEADVRLLERGALVTALVLVRERALVDAERRARRDLVEALISASGDREALRRRAVAAGLKPTAPHAVAVFVPEHDHDAAGAAAADAVARFGGLVAERDDHVVAIIPIDDGQSLVAWLRRRLSPGTVTVGMAMADNGIVSLADAHAEARRCLAATRALGRPGEVASPDELGIYRFLLAPAGQVDAANFIERTVGPILAADGERGSELAITLETYLASGRHHAATAAELHIHPNTLYQRLDRISAILGPDWRAPDRCLEVQMALRLRRLAGELDAGRGGGIDHTAQAIT
jgi:hypothetical protein